MVVQWNVMHARADVAGRQGRDEAVPIIEVRIQYHPVEMSRVFDLGAMGRDLHTFEPTEMFVELGGNPATLRIRPLKPRKLLQSNRGLNVGHVVLEAQILYFVVPTPTFFKAVERALVDAMPATKPRNSFESVVIRHQQTAFTRGDVLYGMEAETREP